MRYEEALKYLGELAKFGVNMGLGRIEELLERLGNPHRRLKVIHVGGTNGKGSTTAMLSSILQEAGWRVGTFTSPHLHSYTERYRINGQEISPKSVADLLGELKPHMEDMVREGFEQPTEFEAGTALAFLYFYRQGVDFAVVEVGLGGAVDSTNVVLPLVSVITNVSMDHMDYLGSTVAEIARVKAGIIKPGVPVVTAAEGEALQVIRDTAGRCGSSLILVGHDVRAEMISHSTEGQFFNVCGRLGRYENLFLPLLGRHQITNAATAVACMEVLAGSGYTWDEAAIRRGLAAVCWPARLEVVRRDPLVIIDGAHNHAGARSLREALREYFPGRSVIFVLGILSDKERSRVVEELVPLARAVVVTRPDNPRAGNWEEVALEVVRCGAEVFVEEDTGRAVELAISLATSRDLVCVTGSLYMAAGAREAVLGLIKKENDWGAGGGGPDFNKKPRCK